MSAQPTILLLVYRLMSGGTERQLTEIAKALHARGWKVHVGCLRYWGHHIQELRDAGIPVVNFPLTSFKSPISVARQLARFGRYVIRHRITLTHCFDMPSTIFGTFAGKIFRRRVVLTSQRAYRTLAEGPIHRALRLTDRITDGIVVNCEAMRTHLIEDEHVAPNLIRVCYNGIDTRRFFPAPDTPRPEELNGALVVGVVCVLRPEKAVDVLVRAFAAMLPQHPAAKLLIVGSGPKLPELESQAESLGIRQHVIFQPDTTDVPLWVNRMDIFVLPSLSEASPNSLMEAMACGKPAIASRVGGTPELMGNDERGLLFEPGDAAALAAQLIRLAGDAALRRRLAANALDFVNEFLTIERSADRMEEIYYEHLGGVAVKTVSSRVTQPAPQTTPPRDL